MPPKFEDNKQVNLALGILENNTQLVCCRCGSSNYKKNGHKHGKQRYLCLDCHRHFCENIDLENYKRGYLELGDDVWNASELGIKVRKSSGETKLVFLHFQQNWLKKAVKKFIKYQATSKYFSQLKCYISDLGKFDIFF